MSWKTIDSIDMALESVDLFGWISYDCIEMRLTDCEFKDGEWWYFQAGEMVKCAEIGFTPTHWMPLPDDPA